MSWTHPKDFLRILDRRYVQVYHDRFLVAAHDHTGERFICVGVDFLVRHKRRYENKISRTCLRDKLKLSSPAHSRSAADDVDYAFQFPGMVRRGFGIGMNVHGAGPELIRPCHRPIDCRRPGHAGSLRRVEVEPIARNDFDTLIAPVLAHAKPPATQNSNVLWLVFLTHDVAIDIAIELKAKARFRWHD